MRGRPPSVRIEVRLTNRLQLPIHDVRHEALDEVRGRVRSCSPAMLSPARGASPRPNCPAPLAPSRCSPRRRCRPRRHPPGCPKRPPGCLSRPRSRSRAKGGPRLATAKPKSASSAVHRAVERPCSRATSNLEMRSLATLARKSLPRAPFPAHAISEGPGGRSDFDPRVDRAARSATNAPNPTTGKVEHKWCIGGLQRPVMAERRKLPGGDRTIARHASQNFPPRDPGGLRSYPQSAESLSTRCCTFALGVDRRTKLGEF